MAETQNPPGSDGFYDPAYGIGLFGGPLLYRAADVENVIGRSRRGRPSAPPGEAHIAIAVEATLAFDRSDASLAAGTPLLTVAESTLLLLPFVSGAFDGPIRNADPLDAFCFGCRLILVGIERCVSSDQAQRVLVIWNVSSAHYKRIRSARNPG